ncbi:alpha/beta fold hydrolase [uncultured Polaribacter sp.]|uniref:alpha/beta fold hydrolase n=1 Tax=uncultured Polaribacter sp. TaxID=174711 RepID=UPI00260EE62F|nr:alpha/beta fold hydrolase [uncultured Polaribacter sp.]
MSKLKDFINPKTQYTKSGEINIAYKVLGKGALDLVYVPGWVSNIDWMFSSPDLVSFFKELSKTVRIILFDKRGTGLSDRLVELSTLEDRMEDINAVMNAVDSKKAILFGHSEGGSAATLFSATYPNKVISLISFGAFAKRRYSKEYPWAPKDKEREKLYNMIENDWCSEENLLEKLAPSRAKDTKFMSWLANYFRSGASPAAAIKLTKMNTEVDIVDVLPYVNVPTLLIQRKGDIDVKIEEGRFIQERIKEAKFIELEGEDHLFWVGNTEMVLMEMKKFIKKTKPNNTSKKGLKTILFGQFKTCNFNANKLDIVAHLIKKYEGEVLLRHQKNISIAFDVPGKAVHFSISFLNKFKELGIELSMGLYINEVTLSGNHILNDKDFYMTKIIQTQLHPNQILASKTVKHLLSGSNFNFIENTSVLGFKSNTLIKLYDVSEKEKPSINVEKTTNFTFSYYDSFLEKVLEIIDNNLENDTISVALLSKKMRMSERQLQRKIKEMTNKSPSQLINSICLNKAKESLMSTNLTVSQTAFKFGFSSPSYFAKCFKKEFNVNPNVFLKKI